MREIASRFDEGGRKVGRNCRPVRRRFGTPEPEDNLLRVSRTSSSRKIIVTKLVLRTG